MQLLIAGKLWTLFIGGSTNTHGKKLLPDYQLLEDDIGFRCLFSLKRKGSPGPNQRKMHVKKGALKTSTEQKYEI